ncbi:MAG: hypothetical protein IT196_14320 [Acidimicrobiales bacterium]|nr:hypothetical protein [Acidimicrobiales bacterium]
MNTTRPSGRLCVEAWSPDYGAPLEDGGAGASEEPTEVDVDIELPAASWRPLRPPTMERATVAFVDGVRRIDASLLWSTDDGLYHPGLAASVAAGVVTCNGRAEISRLEVDRVVLLPVEVPSVQTRHGAWRYRPPQTVRDDPGQLSIELQQVMADLEVAVADGAGRDDELAMVVIDGPIRRREQVRNAVGHIKTHHHRYLPPSVAGVVGELDAGERTPLFAIGGPFPRLSWYLRLPCTREHAWSGVVRNEIAVLPLSEAIALADRAAATLPRFASRPSRDPRAPQNLTPVGGLESRLRHRLGDATLLYRALRTALA